MSDLSEAISYGLATRKMGKGDGRTVQRSHTFHLLPPNNSSNLHESLHVVAGLEQGKLASEEEQEYDTCCPYIYGFWLFNQLACDTTSNEWRDEHTTSLFPTLQQHLRSTKPPRSSSVGFRYLSSRQSEL